MTRVLGSGGALVGALMLSACATKEYVNQQIAPVQAQMTTLQGEVADHSARLTKLDGQATEVQGRADAAYKLAEGKFNFEVVSTDSSTTFDTGKSALSQEDKDRLTAFAQKLKDENKGVYLEIQGHTDIVGPEKSNQTLGRDRAISVGRFLHDQAGVALNRMSIISYGETSPVAPTMKGGNPANRCVTVTVLQ
jgi:outer membrane protein OmpA-like peptidoglycan-associated protein